MLGPLIYWIKFRSIFHSCLLQCRNKNMLTTLNFSLLSPAPSRPSILLLSLYSRKYDAIILDTSKHNASLTHISSVDAIAAAAEIGKNQPSPCTQLPLRPRRWTTSTVAVETAFAATQPTLAAHCQLFVTDSFNFLI